MHAMATGWCQIIDTVSASHSAISSISNWHICFYLYTRLMHFNSVCLFVCLFGCFVCLEFTCTIHIDFWHCSRLSHADHFSTDYQRFEYIITSANCTIGCIDQSTIQYHWCIKMGCWASRHSCRWWTEENTGCTLYANHKCTEKCNWSRTIYW